MPSMREADSSAGLSMLARTDLRLYGSEIRNQLLAPGERMLVLSDFSVAAGKWELEQPPDERSATRKAVETTAGIILAPELANSPSLSRLLGGVAVSGDLGSWARRVIDVRGAPRLLVTDRRLLLTKSSGSGKNVRFEVAFEIPRDAVQNVSREGRPLARGRVVIIFRDGSFIALKVGTWRTGPAARLVTAITAPGTLPPG